MTTPILLVFKSKQNLEAIRKEYILLPLFNGKIGKFTQFLALELISAFIKIFATVCVLECEGNEDCEPLSDSGLLRI